MSLPNFRSYQIVQERKGRVPVVGKLPLVPGIDAMVFGIDVKTGRVMELDGAALRRRLGDRWPLELKRELQRGLFSIYGVDKAGRHRLVLGADGEVEVEDAQVEVGRAGIEPEREPEGAAGSAGSSEGRNSTGGFPVLVRHLRDVSKLRSNAEVLELLRESRLAWIGSALAGRYATPTGVSEDARWREELRRVRKAYSNGRSQHEKACRFCAGGLPEPLRSLVAAYQST